MRPKKREEEEAAGYVHEISLNQAPWHIAKA